MSVELNPLFAKLNSLCHKTFELAAELSVEQSHFSIEIEHVLLKLLEQSDSDVQVILPHYQVSFPKLKRDLNRALEKCRRGNEQTLYLSPSILALLREAWLISSLQLDSHLIRSGAILLAVIDNESLRAGIVKMLPSLMKIPRESLRQQLREFIKTSSEANVRIGDTPTSLEDSSTTITSPKPALEQYTIDLTEMARLERLEPIEGRETEIRQIIDILTRRHQNQPILIGEPGVGKTTVVNGLALKIAKGNVPKPLQNISLRVLDSGQWPAEEHAQFHKRIQSIIEEIKSSAQPIVWFIDDIQTLMAAEKETTHFLKSLLSSGKIRTIVATGWSFYQTHFETDPSLQRQFQPVKIDEPSENMAITMLRCRVAQLEKYHQVRITDKAIRQAVRLSRRYLFGRQLPEKAISVLDTACARVAAAQNSTPGLLETTVQRIAERQEELRLLQREQITGHNHTPRLEKLTSELEGLEQFRTELEERYTTEQRLVKQLRELEDALEQIPLNSAWLKKQPTEEGPDSPLPSESEKEGYKITASENRLIFKADEDKAPLVKEEPSDDLTGSFQPEKDGTPISLAEDNAPKSVPGMKASLPTEPEPQTANHDRVAAHSLPKENRTKPLFIEQTDDNDNVSVSTETGQSDSKPEPDQLGPTFLRQKKNLDDFKPQKANRNLSLLPFKILKRSDKTDNSPDFFYENGQITADQAIDFVDQTDSFESELEEHFPTEASRSPIEKTVTPEEGYLSQQPASTSTKKAAVSFLSKENKRQPEKDEAPIDNGQPEPPISQQTASADEPVHSLYEEEPLEKPSSQDTRLEAEVEKNAQHSKSSSHQPASPFKKGEPGEIWQTELKTVKQQLAQIQADEPLIPTYVDEQLIATVISTWTGIPIDNILTDEVSMFLNIKKKIAERLLGQPQALKTIVQRIQTQRADLDNPNKPMGRLLLVGPTGVGKTETARTLAQILYGGKRHLITLDRSDYQETYTVSSLIGTPLGTKGYGKEGTLLKTVRQHPYCVLLLEEIEHAHPTFIKFLTQVFDKGVLENDSGLRVDFKNTLILLTSQLGKEIITRLCNAPGYSPSPEKLIEALNPLLLQHFQPEFLNPIAVVPYHPLGDLDIRRIIKLKLTELQQRFRDKYHAQLSYSDSLLDAIANRCSEVDSGAHNIDSILTDTLLPSLSTNLLGYLANGQTFSTVHLSCDDLGKLGAQFDTSLELPLAEKEPETVKKSANNYQSNELIDDLNEVLEFVKV